jgi:c-di-GMP-binding flagellar brake protein YcgR
MNTNQFNGSERRAYVRLEKSLPVRFKITGNPMSETFLATTKNISQAGLCLEIQQDKEALLEKLSAADHKIGIDINTLIPQQKGVAAESSLWISGRVDWTRETGQAHQTLWVGLEFEDINEEARKRIREYLVDQFLRKYPLQV